MPRKRVVRSPPEERRSDADDDDDFFFDDSQSSSGRNSQEPVHRNAANARERARMRVLSKAFCRLKTTLPWVPADTKLSKLDTLRLAASYIAHLRALLQDEPRAASQMFPHPLNLAWPFAFQHGGSLSCSISPRWTTSQTDSAGHRPQDPALKDTHYNSAQHYSHETDYEKRCNELDNTVSNQTATGNTVQYNCNYSHKETYYDMRNSYSSDSVMMMHESC